MTKIKKYRGVLCVLLTLCALLICLPGEATAEESAVRVEALYAVSPRTLTAEERGVELFNNALSQSPELYLMGEWTQERAEASDEEFADLTQLAFEITSGCSTDAERIHAVAVYLAQNLGYDWDYYDNKKPEIVYTPAKVLSTGYTVCEGYQRTAECLLNILGIPNIDVDSPNHTWNIAYDGERWILFDATWMSRGGYRDGVLELSDEVSEYWFDFTLDVAMADSSHIIEDLSFSLCGGVLEKFPQYTSMSDYVVPYTVTEIGAQAFGWNDCMNAVFLPESVKRIGDRAFYACKNLTYITVPGVLDELGEEVFSFCERLEQIDSSLCAPQIGKYMFYGCSSLRIINGSIVADTIGEAAFYNCTALTTVNGSIIAGTVGEAAFYECSGLSLINGELRADELSYGAFARAKSLKTVKNGIGVKKIGNSAFEGCASLKDVVFTEGTEVIGYHAFGWCEGMKSVQFPSSLTTIENEAFIMCTALETVAIPITVTTIGNSAFDYCWKLYSISCAASEKPSGWDSNWIGLHSNAKAIWGAEHAHRPVFCDAKAATCTENGVLRHYHCTVCGLNFEDMACTRLMDTVTLPATGHSFTEETVAPTCTTDGYIGEVCLDCNAHRYAAIYPATGHTFEAVVTPPTCTAGGYTTNTCTVCKECVISDLTDAYGHAPVWTVVIEPTCTEDGSNEAYCDRCGAFLGIDIVFAGGHTEGERTTVREATCSEPGYWECRCTVCAELLESGTVPKTEHSYEETVVTPTCTESGYTVHVCTVCGDTFTDNETKPTEHIPGDPVIIREPTCLEEGVAELKCKFCGLSLGTTVLDVTGHKYITTVYPPTCTVQGYTHLLCEVCGTESDADFTAPKGHTPGEWVTVTEPTCTSEGFATRYCTECNVKLDDSLLDKLPHSYEDTVVAPTCTAGGYTTHVCTVCGETVTDSETEPVAHTPGSWITVFEPTCTEEGSAELHCRVCKTLIETKVLEKGKHSYLTATVAPTCTEEGYTTYVCEVCGDRYKGDITLPNGHTGGEWTVTTPATCVAEGVTEQRCKDCNLLLDVAKVARVPHSYEDTVVAPTCTEQGYTAHICAACGDSVNDTFTSPLGHKKGSWTVVKKPTCIEKGVQELHCSVCDAVMETKEEKVTGHVTKQETVPPTCTEQGYKRLYCINCGKEWKSNFVPALGHDFVWVTDREPTEDECGYKHEECQNCHEKRNENTEIEQLVHIHRMTYVRIVLPTCTTVGHTEHYFCELCGKAFADHLGEKEWEDLEIPMLAHTAGEWIRTKQPTVLAEGEETRFCTVCHVALETRPIEKLEGIPGDVNQDGVLDALDYFQLKRHILCGTALTEEEFAYGDVNRDGTVDALDYFKIKQLVLGIE